MQAGGFFADTWLSEKQIADSGLTAGWVLDILFGRSVEFREALGSGKIKDVRGDLRPEISVSKGVLACLRLRDSIATKIKNN